MCIRNALLNLVGRTPDQSVVHGVKDHIRVIMGQPEINLVRNALLSPNLFLKHCGIIVDLKKNRLLPDLKPSQNVLKAFTLQTVQIL